MLFRRLYRFLTAFTLIGLFAFQFTLVACEDKNNQPIQGVQDSNLLPENKGQETSGGGGSPLYLDQKQVQELAKITYERLFKNQAWLIRKSTDQVFYHIKRSYGSDPQALEVQPVHNVMSEPDLVFYNFFANALEIDPLKEKFNYEGNNRVLSWGRIMGADESDTLFIENNLPKLSFENCERFKISRPALYDNNSNLICIDPRETKISPTTAEIEMAGLIIHEFVHYIQNQQGIDFRSDQSEKVASLVQTTFSEFYSSIDNAGQLLTNIENYAWYINHAVLKFPQVCNSIDELNYLAGISLSFDNLFDFNRLSYKFLYQMAQTDIGFQFINHFNEMFHLMLETLESMRVLTQRANPNPALPNIHRRNYCDQFAEEIDLLRTDLLLIESTLGTVQRLTREW